MPWEGIVEHHLKRSPEPPLPRLLPGLLDPVLTREHAALNETPCAFPKPNWGRRHKRHRSSVRPYIPTIDYGFPKDFSAYLLSCLSHSLILTLSPSVPDTECGAVEPPDEELDSAWDNWNDFAFLIPLSCPTSTPIAISRRLASDPSPEPDTNSPASGNRLLTQRHLHHHLSRGERF